MPIYLDLTSFISVNFITGIQRVVWEVVIRLLKLNNNIILIAYNEELRKFNKISNQNFINYYEHEKGNKNEIVTEQLIDISELKQGSVFFDIDSTWNNKVKRSYLFPILKNQGVKIIVHVYDIIPVVYPQYCHQDTVLRFLDYIGSTIQYADRIITNTKSTKEDIESITNRIGIPSPEITVVPLGSDFKERDSIGEIDENVIEIVKEGKYILQVGTIEPRKNHKLVLDAFEKKIKDLGINLIFVGRLGWNVEELENRINKHEELGKRLYHLQGCNDETVDYLYKNAFLTIFPTYYEGFGLPIIESIERGVPVISSDCKVLREVGGDYCDYFNAENADELIEKVEFYEKNPNEYNLRRESIKQYKSATWDQSAGMMSKVLQQTSGEKRYEPGATRQVVMLTAQDDIFLDTMLFIEKFMKFIEEVVVVCPNRISEKIKAEYNGNLQLEFLTDEELLKDTELPRDHSTRNFLLRCMAMKADIIDDVFIMSDDDYRPLVPIEEDTFIQYGKYNAYYSYELSKWGGTFGEPTSYDNSMKKTYDFLKSEGLPSKQYSAHMPQIIDKRIYLDILVQYSGIEYTGLDEWSLYFNFAEYNYPEIFEIQIYKTLCWPALPTDWDMEFYPKEYLFENYYVHLYEKNNLFYGFSTKYNDNIILENMKKIKIRDILSQEYQAHSEGMLAITKMYEYVNREKFEICINIKDSEIDLSLPKFFIGAGDYCSKINLRVQNEKSALNEINKLRLSYKFETEDGIVLQNEELSEINYDLESDFIIPIWTPKESGECILEIVCIDIKTQSRAHIKIPVFIYK